MEDTSPLLPWWSRIWFDVQRWSSRSVAVEMMVRWWFAHGGSMGYGVAVAARCREDGEAVAAGNSGT